MNEYELVIGLEIHVELKTKSGMFCGCPADHFGKVPNTQTCPVCLGLPGALPVPNKTAIDWTIMLGLALGSNIAEVSKFDRKHYFYPDLPKGYQISQYDQPLCKGGVVKTSFGDVRIHRVHLEEDTGKLQHKTVNGKRVTLVDFNRSGAPLMEIVTEPDMQSSAQATEFLKKLHQIIRFVGISDADMEKGSMRLEPNISVRMKGSRELPAYKVEVKNINSFKFAAAAIEYEFKRHIALFKEGKVPAQETRGWDERQNATVSQRNKEGASDYRYFPEPDIPPLRFSKEYIEDLRKLVPELPDAKVQRFMNEYELSEMDSVAVTLSKDFAEVFERMVVEGKKTTGVTASNVAKWLINKKSYMADLSPEEFVRQLIQEKQVVQVSDVDLQKAIESVFSVNSKAIADYKAGKEQSAMFLMGMVRRKLPKADVAQILDALKKSLKS